MKENEDSTPLPVIHVHGFQPFTIAIYVISASVSLLAFLYGLLIVYLDRNIWKNHIVRIIVIVQVLNCLRFILRTVASFIPLHSSVGCRILVFLNNALTTLPVNLCVYCVVYLQVLIVHKVSPYKRWPRIIFITFAILTSVFPTASYLYISPRRAGLESYCSLPLNFPHRFYVFYMISVALWQYLSGVIGVISVSIIANYIWRARRASRYIAERSTYSYGLSRNIVHQYQSKVLHRTLVTIIWYPITPIISQWMNLILYSVSHYTKRTYTGLEFMNIVLLGLQSVLLGIGLVVYPAVQRVFKQKIRNRWKHTDDKAKAISTMAHREEVIGRELSPVSRSSIFSTDSPSSSSSSSSNSVSAFEITLPNKTASTIYLFQQ